MNNIVFILALLCCYLIPWQGQSATAIAQRQEVQPFFKGVVFDFVTKAPIRGAKVEVEGTQLRATSDEKGEFEIRGWTPGVYTIRVTHPEYKPLIRKNWEIHKGGVHAGLVLKSGTPNDKPLVVDMRPRGQFVIDEDAEPIERREPVYPESALKDKTEGTVLLWVSVNEEGEVPYAWVSEGVREDLNRAALETVQHFKFKPAKVKGKPVAVMVTIPFVFKLADKSSSFPLELTGGPLTNEDILSALNYLGVQMYRFTYRLPFKHQLRLSLDQYLDGKLKDSKSTRVGTSPPGLHNVTLFKYVKEDSVQFTVRIGAGADVGSITFDKISMKGFPSVAWFPLLGAQMQSGTKTPFCALVLNPWGMQLAVREPLENIISKNKLVVVAAVELRLE